MNLLELTQEYAAILQEIEQCGGELNTTQELRYDEICRSLAAAPDKAEFVLKKLDTESKFYADRIDQLKAYKDALDNAATRFKDQIRAFMQNKDKKRIEGDYVDIVLKGTKPKVIVLDEDKVDSKYKRIHYSMKIDKNDIYKDMQNGALVEGVTLEQNYSLTFTRAKK